MIYVDANYFLRFLVRPATPQDKVNAERARTLFRLVGAGEETIITSHAVIAEVVFILHSPRHYGYSRKEIADRLKPILQLPGCKVPRKRLCLQALALWVESPKLSFVDALGAAYAIDLGIPLATFDATLKQLSGVVPWPAAGGGPDSNGTSASPGPSSEA